MSRRPVVIDADPGVDDAVAILLALASPELDVLGITAVAGNVGIDLTARNACKVCELAGRGDMAVYAGCSRPLVRDQVFGKYASEGGLAGNTLPEPAMRPRTSHAVDFLVSTLADAARKVTVCALGPMTNLAVALRRSPRIAAGIEQIVAMGGAFAALGNRSPAAEFNFLADPHAARVVLASGVPVDLVPLDLTFQALATPERLEAMRAAGAVGEKTYRLVTYFDRGDAARFGGPGGPLHDPVVVASLLWPDLFERRPARVEVETTGRRTLGHSSVDWHSETPNATVLTRIEAGGFYDRLAERLRTYAATA